MKRNNSVTIVFLMFLVCVWSLAGVGFGEGKEVSGERRDLHLEATEAYNVEARIARWRPHLVEGVSGKAYLLDRWRAHIDVQDSASLDISGNEITISAWIKPKGMRYGQEIISKSAATDEAWKIAIAREKLKNRKMSNEGRINFYLELGNIDANFLSKKLIKPGTWYHVGCVYNAREKIIYIDGEVDSKQSVSGEIGENDEPVKIGGGSKNWYSGAVDEVAIYNRALSATDIRRFYLNKRKPKADEPGLVAYWSFDNDQDIIVKDGSSNHNDGKLISGWSAQDAKYSDPRQFVRKAPGFEGAFPYSEAKMYIWKDQLPMLYEMLEDANYAPYWHNVARLIGYVSDDPNSIPHLLSYFKKDDSYNFRTTANLDNFVGKIWCLAHIGMIGGDRADTILKEAVTLEGAAKLAENWIDGRLVENNRRWGQKDEVLSYLRSAAIHGLVYTDKQENIEIVKRMYFGNGADREHNPTMRLFLLEGVVISEYIRHHGREAFFQLCGNANKLLEALDPYFIKYRAYEEQVQKNEQAETPATTQQRSTF
ncbi:MAG: LamG domain-containing protein [Planctomycetota bacterium]|jgi:hypothetical protein